MDILSSHDRPFENTCGVPQGSGVEPIFFPDL